MRRAWPRVRDEITVKLNDESVGQLSQRNLAYDAAVTLQPGTYTLKLPARENETGRMVTFETKSIVPDPTTESQTLPIGSLALSSQREKPKRLELSALVRNSPWYRLIIPQPSDKR